MLSQLPLLRRWPFASGLLLAHSAFVLLTVFGHAAREGALLWLLLFFFDMPSSLLLQGPANFYYRAGTYLVVGGLQWAAFGTLLDVGYRGVKLLYVERRPLARFPRFTVLAGFAAVLGNIAATLPFVVTLLFLTHRHGHARLLIEALVTGFICLMTLLVAFPLACIAAFRERFRILGILFMCMAFTPFPLSAFALREVAAIRDITLE
jgi:hypothetical protein